MIQDFVHIRKGTNPKTALKKSVKILWEYLLSNSKNFELEEGININFSGGKV